MARAPVISLHSRLFTAGVLLQTTNESAASRQSLEFLPCIGPSIIQVPWEKTFLAKKSNAKKYLGGQGCYESDP
jgi:hypothetical protein